jgi:hypothetical protein
MNDPMVGDREIQCRLDIQKIFDASPDMPTVNKAVALEIMELMGRRFSWYVSVYRRVDMGDWAELVIQHASGDADLTVGVAL